MSVEHAGEPNKEGMFNDFTKSLKVIKSGEVCTHSYFLLGNMNYKAIKEIVEYDKHITEHNIEQLVAKLLFDLTRNTGFEVSKGKIGDCWIKSCCEWDARMEDDICGLDYSRLSIYDKMKSIYDGTCLKKQLHAAGLEVAI